MYFNVTFLSYAYKFKKKAILFGDYFVLLFD